MLLFHKSIFCFPNWVPSSSKEKSGFIHHLSPPQSQTEYCTHCGCSANIFMDNLWVVVSQSLLKKQSSHFLVCFYFFHFSGVELLMLSKGKDVNSVTLGAAAAAAKSLQSCPTLCDPIDGSPPGSPVPGILQARTLEWVAISFSSACKWKVKVKLLSRIRLVATPWTADYQAPLSMGFSRQEYWSGVPLPSAGLPWAYITYIYVCGLFVFNTKEEAPKELWHLCYEF